MVVLFDVNWNLSAWNMLKWVMWQVEPSHPRSQTEVTGDERDKAGMDVEGFPPVLARASACHRAEREAAEAMGVKAAAERFLNIEVE